MATFKNNKQDIKTTEDGENKSLTDSKKDNTTINEENNSKELEGKIINQLIHQIDLKKAKKSSFKITQDERWYITLAKSFLYVYLGVYFTYLLFNVGYPTLDIKPPVDIPWTVVIASTMVWAIVFVILRANRSNKGVSRITFQGNTIDLFDKNVDSVFNKYLDDIIYLITKSGYTTIIFEDIDRYENNEIFAKLRELNYLANKRRDNKNIIKFIYLLKDDQLISKERTKFFDLIIPIIPTIDSSNSYDMLVNDILKLEKHETSSDSHPHKLDDNLLEMVSYYIDDIRILKNIYNEYIVYHNRLKKAEVAIKNDKLFAIICYKNIFPRDFAETQYNRGYLTMLFSKEAKQLLIDKKLKSYEQKNEELQQEISNLDNEKLENINELIATLLIPKNDYWFYSETGSRTLNIYNTFPDFIADAIKNRSSSINNNVYFYSELNRVERNSDFTRRRMLIENKQNNSIKEFELQIKENEIQIESLKTSKLKVLLGDNETFDQYTNSLTKKEKDRNIENYLPTDDFKIIKKENWWTNSFFSDDEMQYTPVIKYLILSEHIDESYSDYLSLFLGDKNDKNFLIAAITFDSIKPNYKVNNPEKIIKKLNETHFNNAKILNFDITNELLKNNANGYMDVVANTIIENKEKDFIINHFKVNNNSTDLIVYLINYVAKSFIECHFLQEFLCDNANILLQVPNIEWKNLAKVNLKTSNIEDFSPNKEFLKFTYNSDMYVLNNTNIQFLVNEFYKNNHQETSTREYSVISSEPNQPLFRYVYRNIDEYVKMKFLTAKDEEEEIINILNSNALEETKVIYLDTPKNKLNDISKIENIEIMKYTMKNSNATVNFINIITYFFEFGDVLDDDIIDQINKTKDLEQLKCELSSLEIEEEKVNSLFYEIIDDARLDDDKYMQLLSNYKLHYDEFSFQNISESKIGILIELGIIGMTKDNIEFIRTKYPELSNTFAFKTYDNYANIVLENDIFDIGEAIFLLNKDEVNNECKENLIKSNNSRYPLIKERTGDKVVMLIMNYNLQKDDEIYLFKFYNKQSQELKEEIKKYFCNKPDKVTGIDGVNLEIIDSIIMDPTVTQEQKKQLIIDNFHRYDERLICKVIVDLPDFIQIKNINANVYIKNTINNGKLLQLLREHSYINWFKEITNENRFKINRNTKKINELLNENK